jgi:hypothetical protein
MLGMLGQQGGGGVQRRVSDKMDRQQPETQELGDYIQTEKKDHPSQSQMHARLLGGEQAEYACLQPLSQAYSAWTIELAKYLQWKTRISGTEVKLAEWSHNEAMHAT